MTNFSAHEIKEQKISLLLDEVNGFFAFSNDQLKAGVKEGIKYVSCGAGLFLEKGKSGYFDKKLKEITKEYRKKNLSEKGKKKVILEELHNYECFYTGEIDDAVESLKEYNITKAEVLKVYQDNLDIND